MCTINELSLGKTLGHLPDLRPNLLFQPPTINFFEDLKIGPWNLPSEVQAIQVARQAVEAGRTNGLETARNGLIVPEAMGTLSQGDLVFQRHHPGFVQLYIGKDTQHALMPNIPTWVTVIPSSEEAVFQELVYSLFPGNVRKQLDIAETGIANQPALYLPLNEPVYMYPADIHSRLHPSGVNKQEAPESVEISGKDQCFAVFMGANPVIFHPYTAVATDRSDYTEPQNSQNADSNATRYVVSVDTNKSYDRRFPFMGTDAINQVFPNAMIVLQPGPDGFLMIILPELKPVTGDPTKFVYNWKTGTVILGQADAI